MDSINFNQLELQKNSSGLRSWDLRETCGGDDVGKVCLCASRGRSFQSSLSAACGSSRHWRGRGCPWPGSAPRRSAVPPPACVPSPRPPVPETLASPPTRSCKGPQAPPEFRIPCALRASVTGRNFHFSINFLALLC